MSNKPNKSKISPVIQAQIIPFLVSKPGKIMMIAIAVVFALFVLIQNMGGSGIADIATQELKNIKNGDLNKAYHLTSTDFQQKNSLDVFSSYAQSNPIFQQYDKVDFSQNKIDNGVGFLKGDIEGKDGSKEGIEMQLVQEDNQWRIQVFQLTGATEAATATGSNAAASDTSGASIHDLLISDAADLDGYVQDVKTTIPSSAQKIFVTVELVAPPSGGAKIQAVLHLPGMHAKIGPSVADLTGSGSVLKAFVFARTASSWPTGEYSVTVSLTTGATLTQKFNVE